jgi:hypothetical protein
MAERTGCPILLSLWSYVTVHGLYRFIMSTDVSLAVASPDTIERLGIINTLSYLTSPIITWMSALDSLIIYQNFPFKNLSSY